jgi:FAD/FMN-containing dehydrogenase
MGLKQELAEVVGAENVFDDRETLRKYAQDMSLAEPRKPAYVVKVKSADEVRKLVELANKELLPLTPVSSPDGPRFHGDTIPAPGGVVVDLSRLNRVLKVDRRNRVAHIQPGVTFSELSSQLKESGLKPFLTLLPRRTKSVLTSYLEKNPILIPRHHWDTLDPILTLEVVYGTGDVMRTGSAAGPGTTEELIAAGVGHVSPFGPDTMDFARLVQGAQGTMGIVTRATCACSLMPTIQRPYFVTSEKMGALIEFMYALLRKRLGEELFLINGFALANMSYSNPEEIKSVSAELAPWIVFLNIAGYEKRPEERVAYQEEDIREIAKEHGLTLLRSVVGVSAFDLLKRLEEPSEDSYWKLQFKGNCQDISFTTTLDRVQELVAHIYKIAALHGYACNEIGIYIQPVVQGSSCQCEIDLRYNPENVREVEQVKRLYLNLCETLANLGAFYSRPYGAMADIAYRRDAETTALLRKVKAIFDPKNILNPGKLCF